MVAGLLALTQVYLPEEFHRINHTLEIFLAAYPQFQTAMGTYGEEDCFVTLLPQIIQSEIRSQPLVGLRLYAQSEYVLNLSV